MITVGLGPLAVIALSGIYAAAVALPGPGRAEAPRSTGDRRPRALWMWATERAAAVVSDESAWPEFFGFCDAPHGCAGARLSAIYLEVSRGCPETALRKFLASAHARGLTVEYLFGDGDWQAAHLEAARRVCEERIAVFNTAGPPAERFDGIHLDLENGGKWSQQAYRELLRFLREKVDGYNASQSHRMTLAADLAFWWSERGDDATPQFPDAVARCDYVVSMAYRDTAGAQVSCSIPEALAAARQGTGLYIGAETQRLVDQDFVTYYEEGWEHMERELARLPALLADQGGALAGVAIHHYDSYRDMTQGRRARPFSDVRLDYWALPHIVAARAAGIVLGYPGGTYQPTSPVLREQMAVFISHAIVGAGNVPEGPSEPSFRDVPADHWAYKYVECAKSHNVVSGFDAGLYRPEQVVNRGELAVFVARSVASPTGESGLAGVTPPSTPTFADVTPENEWSWCYRHVEYLAARGVAEPAEDARYHPGDPCTREQVAVYMVKALGIPV